MGAHVVSGSFLSLHSHVCHGFRNLDGNPTHLVYEGEYSELHWIFQIAHPGQGCCVRYPYLSDLLLWCSCPILYLPPVLNACECPAERKVQKMVEQASVHGRVSGNA